MDAPAMTTQDNPSMATVSPLKSLSEATTVVMTKFHHQKLLFGQFSFISHQLRKNLDKMLNLSDCDKFCSFGTSVKNYTEIPSILFVS